MDSNEFDVRRTVVSVLDQCSNCKHQYSMDDARVIERQGDLWVLSVQCSHCDAQAYVAAVVGGDGTDVGDFTQPINNQSDNSNGDPVTVDNVLDLHEFLETFDGDFSALFNRHRR